MAVCTVYCMEMGDLLFQYIMHELWQYFSVELFSLEMCLFTYYLFDLTSIFLQSHWRHKIFFHSFIVWHCANQPYFDWAERLKQNMRETHTLKLKWNETKRNEMGWNEMKCVYTRLIILYHSDHNLWKFVFVFFSIYFVRSFVVFFWAMQNKRTNESCRVFVAAVLLLSLSTTIINSFKLTVNYIFRLMCTERKSRINKMMNKDN